MPNFTNVKDLLTHYREVKARIKGETGARTSAVVIPFKRPEPELKHEFHPKPDFRLEPIQTVDIDRANTPKDILIAVAQKYEISVEDLRSNCRQPTIALAKKEASWRMRQLNRLSLNQIANFVGVTNHATVFYHIKKYEEILREGYQPKKEIWASEAGTVSCAAGSTTMPRSSDGRRR